MDSDCGRPDRGWSWVVAFACCFSSLILAGIFRTSGVLFVAFIGDFGVSREEASWPMVLCISVLNLTGPFSGILARKFGGRPVIITGAVVGAAGISACYFTTSLKVITILFGGVFGVGYGFMNTVMPGILNAYFLNLRATANGIANSGSCIGSIILPITFEHFISSYGLSGCFLLTGGIVLHITIAGALMRPPPWLAKRVVHTSSDDCEKSVPKRGSDLFEQNTLNRTVELVGTSKACSLVEIQSSSNDVDREAKARGGAVSSSDVKYCPVENVKTPLPSEIDSDPQKEQTKVESDDNEQPQRVSRTIGHIPRQSKEESDDNEQIASRTTGHTIPRQTKEESDDNEQIASRTTGHTIPRQNKAESDDREHMQSTSDQTTSANNPNRYLCPGSTFGRFENLCKKPCLDIVQPFRSVLTCPMFYVTAITNVTFYFLYHMYVVIIVDYSLDTGVPESNTKYILFAFSLSDLFGRLCLGWITDRQLVSRTRFVMGCMVLIGIVFFMFPLAKGYWPLVAVSCSYGLLLGCTMVVFPILLVDFLGIELHSVSYGCMCFMNGFASFGRPFLIGYFRDSVGSYSSMFYVLGSISVVASMLWLMEGVLQKKQEPLASQK